MYEPPPDSRVGQPLPEIGSYGEFIGREQELSEVNERLRGHRLVTLVGPGGMGKTRLALETIMRKRADSAHGAEIAFVSLELVTENTEGALLDALTSGLKLIPGDAGGVLAALVNHLKAIHVLLVLDNCETARTSLAVLVAHLLRECPELSILATSQHQLGLGDLEAVYELPPLSVPDDRPGALDTLENLESYKLFVARAQRAAASWTPEEDSAPSLRRLLQLTDGIPLAIEIIAAWAPVMSLAQICEELERTPFAPVTKRDDYDLASSERHRSMLRCFEWSFSHLAKASPKDAEGFERLGVFAGRFTEEAVGKVCEVDAPRELLSHLAKMSLIHPCLGTTPRRYVMLRFTRAFAQEKAGAGGNEHRLIERHVDFFFKLASPSSDESEWDPEPSGSFEHEWPDMVAAANAAPRVGNLQAVWQISRALGPFLRQQGFWSERERLNRAAVQTAYDAGYWAAMERSLIDLGIILEAQGRWQEAAAQYRRSLYFSNRNVVTPSPNHQAMALQHLGAVLTRLGDADGATRARKKLSEITPLLVPSAQARSLDEEGKLFEGDGDLANAEAKYREAFRIRESIGDAKGLAKSKENLGLVLTLQGEWPLAESMLQECLAYWTSQNDTRMQGFAMHHLADLLRRQRRYVEARDYCEKALSRIENDPKGRAATLLLLGRILLAGRDFDNALIAFQESKQICRSLGDAEGESMALDDIGSAYTMQRKWTEALTALNESLELKQSKTRRDIIGLGITLDRIARIHSRHGNWSAAQTACSSSLKFFQDARKGIPAARTLMNMAMIHAAQGQKLAALATLDEAIGLLRSEQSGMSVLKVAREIRSRLERRMIDGVAWMHWEYAEFKSQQLSIRRRFDRERRDERWGEAAVGYELLAKEYIESGQQMEAGLALNELAVAHRHLGDFLRSEDAIRQALAIFKEIISPLGLAASWHKLGDLFEEQGKFREAEDAYAESIRRKIECSDEDGEGISQDALALVLIKAGRFDDAERAATRALEIFSEGGSAWQKWHPLIRILWLKVEQNNVSEAQALAARLVDAVRGNRELEVAASEMHAMAVADDWDGVKAYLARAGITGPVEVPVPTPADEGPGKASSATCSLRRRGQGWEICFKGDGPFQMRDTVGVRYLATLLGSGGEPTHCSRLASSRGRAAVSSSLTAENTPVLSPDAKRAYRVKLAELTERIATAESRGLADEVFDLKEEAEEIGAALGAAHDKLGGDQGLGEDGNRVRNAVCNPIRRVMNALRDDMQTREIGLHLIDQVDLGFNCVYPKNREKGFPWVVEQ